MRIKIFALLLVAIVSMLALASCAEEVCEHTFSEAWTFDKNQHWHQATCEHGEVKGSPAAHTDADEDGKCDVCQYEVGHEHTFSGKWTYDEESHWKAATCSHTDEKKDFDLHLDDDLNNSCDVCGAHVHSVNPLGFCTGCNEQLDEIDVTEISDLVNAILYQSYRVNKVEGTFNFSTVSRNEKYYNSKYSVWESYSRTSEQVISITFGKNSYVHSYITTKNTTDVSSNTGATESWHEASGKDGVFGFVQETLNGQVGEKSLDSVSVDKLNGNYYTFSDYIDGHGTENFLYNIFLASQDDNVVDINIEYLDNKVNLQFSVLAVTELKGSTSMGGGSDSSSSKEIISYNVSYYMVDVSFTYDDEFTLTSLDASLAIYKNDVGQLFNGNPNLLDITLQYYPETDTFDFVKYNASTEEFEVVDRSQVNAITYSYSITQQIGERIAENPHPKSLYIPDSYDLFATKDENGNLSNPIESNHTITISVGDLVSLYFGNYSPAECSVMYASELLDFKVYDYYNNLVDHNSYKVFFLTDTFAGQQKSFFFIPKVAGTYFVEVYFDGELTHEIKVLAGDTSVDEEINFDPSKEFVVRVTEAHEWSNVLSFTVNKSCTYHFDLPSGIGIMSADMYDLAPESALPFYDYNGVDEYGNDFKNADGTYKPASVDVSITLIKGNGDVTTFDYSEDGGLVITLAKGETEANVRFYFMAPEKGNYVVGYSVK